MKDAIGVLWSKDADVEIRSSGYEYTFGMKEKSQGSSYKTLHAYIKEIEADDFIGTEFRIYNCPSTYFEEAILQFIKFQNLKILFTTNKGQIIDKAINEAASIYVNGMKIAEDYKLRFSYNITRPSSKIQKGINRERKYVSRSVYQSDIVKILQKIDDEFILDILVDQLKRTFDNDNFEEILWKDVIIKICNYVINKGDTVFVSNGDIERNTELYNLISQNRDIKLFKISPDIKRILQSNLKLVQKTKIFLENYLSELQQTISLEDLTDKERNILNEVIKLLKTINVLKGESYLLNTLRISKDNSSYTDENKGIIIIPRECLNSIENCSSKLINSLSSIRHGSSQFKDYVIGELCAEFLKVRSEKY